MKPCRTALVTGSTGTVGRCLADALVREDRWRVVGVSRGGSGAKEVAGLDVLALDLGDRDACVRAIAGIDGLTHVFHAARHDFHIGQPEPILENLRLLENLLDAASATGQPLQHVHIVQGTKYYGSNLGPFETPTPETAPRSRVDNFYFHQEDLVIGRAAREGWSWSASRPHAVVDPQRALPRSVPTIIAIYATVLRELGLPLHFPGTEANFRALYQFTDAGLLGRAIAWMATTDAARDQAFNVTNGDCLRWCHLWPSIAQYFGMECGTVRTVQLVAFMADKEDAWQRAVRRHGLRETRYRDLATWSYGDFVLQPHWDHLLSLNRIRDLGFVEHVNTRAMLFSMFDRLRQWRVIPSR